MKSHESNRYVLQAIHREGYGLYVKDMYTFGEGHRGDCYYHYTSEIDDAFHMTAEQAVQVVQAVTLDRDELPIGLVKIIRGPTWIEDPTPPWMRGRLGVDKTANPLYIEVH